MLPSLRAGIGNNRSPYLCPLTELTPVHLKLLRSLAREEQGHLVSVCSWFLHLACVLLVTRANSVKEMLKRASRKHGPWASRPPASHQLRAPTLCLKEKWEKNGLILASSLAGAGPPRK